MIRFIFACMAMVAFSMLAIIGQTMVDGINTARNDINARNMQASLESPQTPASTGPSFEEIYAMVPTPEAPIDVSSPEALNNIDTAAGAVEDDFTGGFTNIAPKALADDPVDEPLTGQTN